MLLIYGRYLGPGPMARTALEQSRQLIEFEQRVVLELGSNSERFFLIDICDTPCISRHHEPNRRGLTEYLPSSMEDVGLNHVESGKLLFQGCKLRRRLLGTQRATLVLEDLNTIQRMHAIHVSARNIAVNKSTVQEFFVKEILPL
jgi:hypothetical protein